MSNLRVLNSSPATARVRPMKIEWNMTPNSRMNTAVICAAYDSGTKPPAMPLTGIKSLDLCSRRWPSWSSPGICEWALDRSTSLWSNLLSPSLLGVSREAWATSASWSESPPKLPYRKVISSAKKSTNIVIKAIASGHGYSVMTPVKQPSPRASLAGASSYYSVSLLDLKASCGTSYMDESCCYDNARSEIFGAEEGILEHLVVRSSTSNYREPCACPSLVTLK